MRDLLRARGKELKLLAEALMERETLDQAQIKSVLGIKKGEARREGKGGEVVDVGALPGEAIAET